MFQSGIEGYIVQDLGYRVLWRVQGFGTICLCIYGYKVFQVWGFWGWGLGLGINLGLGI